MGKPYFSIIIPTYNRAKFLPRTIQCVLDQTFSDWELIIVDDGSNDNSYEIIKTFNDDRIRYIKNEVNIERCDSRNLGIDHVYGKYICFLDSDDEYLNNHLEILHDRIIKDGEPVALFYVSALHAVNEGSIEKRITPAFDDQDKFSFIMRYTFNPTSVGVHNSILKEYKFDTILYCLEDIDLWLHIALKYPIIKLPQRTILLKFHDESFTVGDYYRFTKELRNFKYIFNKPEFKGVLPKDSKKRLLSMCNYKLAVRYEQENKIYEMYKCILKSFFLYPKGYNSRTNLPMLVMFIKHLPLLNLIFKLRKRLK